MQVAVKPVVGAGADMTTAILGVVSLLIWALVMIVTIKYVALIMRADNHGEGGILSEVVLVEKLLGKKGGWVLGLGMVGAAFFFGDAMITPAISVISAVEGLELPFSFLTPYVVPITLAILVPLFVFQYKGTDGVAKFFAPVMVVWFAALAVLGIIHLADAPVIWNAFNPMYGIRMLINQSGLALLVVGGVFLAVTGGEALYADMGHFGKTPIRFAWLFVVFPSLLLNYLGQGAFVIANPKGLDNPFFQMAPEWALIPLIFVATLATVIASQAVITGAYSIAQQGIALGLIPRMNIVHTSETESGQIYVSQINWMVMIGVVILVIIFKSSDNLASAYGIAVNVAMLINTVLAVVYFWKGDHAHRLIFAPVLFIISLVELAFLVANCLKIANGGYLPLLIGATVIGLMFIWRRGISNLTAKLRKDSVDLIPLLESLEKRPPSRVAGAAVFLQTDNKFAPSAMMHNLKHNRVLHDRLVFLAIKTVDQPRWYEDRVNVTQGPMGAWIVEAKFGYMEQPDVPAALRACAAHGLEIDPRQASYFLGRRIIKLGARSSMPFWQQRVFIMLTNQSARAIDFFRIPADRVVELGMQMSV